MCRGRSKLLRRDGLDPACKDVPVIERKTEDERLVMLMEVIGVGQRGEMNREQER